MTKSEIITTAAIAWYGAIVATLTLIFMIYNVMRDRAKIVLKFQKGMRFLKGRNYSYKTDKDYFIITVINKGRRPITITQVGCKLKQKKNSWYVASESFIYRDKELREGKNIDFAIEQDLIDFSKLLFIWAYDATGQMYKKRFSYLPLFLRKFF